MERDLNRFVCVDVHEGDPRTCAPTLRKGPIPELAFDEDKRWQTGQVLLISFLDGEPALWSRVEKHAREWTRHANLRFDFGGHAHPDIRISFRTTGYSSLLGTDAARQRAAEPTMSLGGFTASADEDELRRVVLHEFGHALGCIHEHQSPSARIPWDEDAVYRYYRDHHGWPREQVKHNVIDRYASSLLRFSERHDPLSIMQYPVPRELTGGQLEIGWNSALSVEDKRFIALMYPGRP